MCKTANNMTLNLWHEDSPNRWKTGRIIMLCPNIYVTLLTFISNSFVIIIIIIVSSRGSFAQPSMASRHSTGVTYSLARNSCWARVCGWIAPYAVEWRNFPRASARRCLTFPHGVYSAHRFSSRSFSSPTRCTGFADSPPGWLCIAEAQYYHSELPTPGFPHGVGISDHM